jgi:hypothetical protein
VNYQIETIEELTGNEATIYFVYIGEEDQTLFDQFVESHTKDFRAEVKSILDRLEETGKNRGARDIFFKLNEGKPGDGVCALYDDPDHKLRLYCIRYGKCAVLLGGGGLKPPGIKTWQQDKQLEQQAQLMIDISRDITQRLASGDLKWSSDGMRLEGNLQISQDDN